MIDDEIRTLLEAPPSGADAPTLDHIEDTLTAGYARALALEAERLRIRRKIAELAARFGEEAADPTGAELATLGERLNVADGDLSQLRALLSSLRTRADEVRSAVSL